MTFKYQWLSAILPALMLAACAQEDIVAPGSDADDDDYIIFHASMPGVEVTSRSYDNIEIGNLAGGFSVTAMNLDVQKVGDKYKIEFKNQPVERTEGMGDAFRGPGCKWPESEDGKAGLRQFFAFYPSIETLKSKLVKEPNDKTDYFLVHHPGEDGNGDQSELRSTGPWFNYRMGNYKINKDISLHFDFVSASAQGSKATNLYSGINLEFEHKLCRVDLKAWGASPSYDIEIAGVRIGGVITKSTYNLAGNWISHAATWDYVEYIFNAGDDKVNRAADQVITIGSGKHSSQNAAVSIMGKGGYALLIPHQPSNLNTNYPYIWDYKENPKNTNNGMYFSVLLRVIDKTDNQGLVLYPYVDGATITGSTPASNKNSVYLVVEEATGTVKGRVYKNKTTKQYFSDSALKNAFSVPAGQEIREYGWAAIPCRAVWRIGNTYTYTLDYSDGVGVHAPDDDAPGKPIITEFAVGVSEDAGTWKMVMDYEDKQIDLDWNTDKIHQE